MTSNKNVRSRPSWSFRSKTRHPWACRAPMGRDGMGCSGNHGENLISWDFMSDFFAGMSWWILMDFDGFCETIFCFNHLKSTDHINRISWDFFKESEALMVVKIHLADGLFMFIQLTHKNNIWPCWSVSWTVRGSLPRWGPQSIASKWLNSMVYGCLW